MVGELCQRGITASLSHSVANLSQAEEAVQLGASFIIYLFNAMLPFHHRDPGIVGFLTSDQILVGRTVFYGMIADGIHSNPAALRIAHRAHPSGLVLVTDAVTAMGSSSSSLFGSEGHQDPGPPSLCSRHKDPQWQCCHHGRVRVRHFKQASGCNIEAALEAASLHPAQLLGITTHKGDLEYGSGADFVLLDDDLNVRATYISGEEVWRKGA